MTYQNQLIKFWMVIQMNNINSLIRQLNSASENLTDENKEVFDDIIVFIRTSNVKSKDAEEFLQQLLDSFLTAQSKNVSLEVVLGTDNFKSYCEDIVTAYKSSYNIFSRLGEYVMYLGMMILILVPINYVSQNLVQYIKSRTLNLSLYLNLSLGSIVEFIVIIIGIIIIMLWINKSCFKEKPKNSKKEFFILWIICSLWIGLIFLSSILLNKILLFKINVVIILILGGILYFSGNYAAEK